MQNKKSQALLRFGAVHMFTIVSRDFIIIIRTFSLQAVTFVPTTAYTPLQKSANPANSCSPVKVRRHEALAVAVKKKQA